MKGHWHRRINQKLSDMQRFLSDRGLLQSFRLALVGFFVAFSLHAGIVVAFDNTLRKVVNQGQLVEVASQSPQPSITSPTQLVQQAVDRYQAGQLLEAIALWQQAVDRYEKTGDRLNQALVLSFLATAFNDFGQQTQAQGAIEQAVSLLNTQNSVTNPEGTSVLAQVLTTQGELQFLI